MSGTRAASPPLVLRLFTTSAVLTILCAAAHADPTYFEHEPGITLGFGAMHAANTDDEVADFAHMEQGQYGLIELGYRFATGAQLVLGGGMSTNIGKEQLAFTFSGSVRQYLRFGRVEPFVEAGIHLAGDEPSDPVVAGVAAGLDWRLPRNNAAIGVAVGHYFSGAEADREGVIDWSARVHATWRFGQ